MAPRAALHPDGGALILRPHSDPVVSLSNHGLARTIRPFDKLRTAVEEIFHLFRLEQRPTLRSGKFAS